MLAERFVYDFWCWANESYDYDFPDRWEEFRNVVGLANALEIEGIKDINLENIGITVSNDVLSEQKKKINIIPLLKTWCRQKR
jgi:hypothetical protein